MPGAAASSRSIPRPHFGEEVEVRIHDARPGVGLADEAPAALAKPGAHRIVRQQQLERLGELGEAAIEQAAGGTSRAATQHVALRRTQPRAPHRPGLERDHGHRFVPAGAHEHVAGIEGVELLVVAQVSDMTHVGTVRDRHLLMPGDDQRLTVSPRVELAPAPDAIQPPVATLALDDTADIEKEWTLEAVRGA